MTAEEALQLLHAAKVVLLDMGLTAQAGETEHYEEVLLHANYRLPHAEVVEVAHALARSALPGGRRGHAALCLRGPAEARALALMAAVLRSVE